MKVFGIEVDPLVVIAAAVLVVAVVLTFWPLEASFDVVCRLEYLRFKIPNESILWSLPAPRIIHSGLSGDPKPESVLGRTFVRVEPLSDVVIQRVGQGPMSIRVLAAKSDGTAVTLSNSAGESKEGLGNRVVITIDEIESKYQLGESIVLPFFGETTIGKYAGPDPAPLIPILRGGEVRVVGHSILTERLFVAGTHQINAGDALRFVPERSAGYGTLSFDSEPGFQVSYRVRAKKVQVNRFGASGYDIVPAVWKRALNDDILFGTWSIFIFLFGAIISLSRLSKKRDD